MTEINESAKIKHREIFKVHIKLVQMMYQFRPVEEIKEAIETIEIYKTEQLNRLLSCAYTEHSYQSIGGDLGYQDNPPIDHAALQYLEEVINWLKSIGAETI